MMGRRQEIVQSRSRSIESWAWSRSVSWTLALDPGLDKLDSRQGVLGVDSGYPETIGILVKPGFFQVIELDRYQPVRGQAHEISVHSREYNSRDRIMKVGDIVKVRSIIHERRWFSVLITGLPTDGDTYYEGLVREWDNGSRKDYDERCEICESRIMGRSCIMSVT